MKKFIPTYSWKEFQVFINERVGDLSNDSLDLVHGEPKDFLGLFQEKFGKEQGEELSGVEQFLVEPSSQKMFLN